MTFTDWAMSLGGIGFLLLGMGMMTEGLKAAAGDSLRSILERSTQTRMRALVTGFSLTALVQSSSAVIMTTLGFTNAGMLGMRKAAWLVFGSNVGTTMTAWIVALIGLKIRLDMIAMPLIGIGILMHLLIRGGRFKHIGYAMAGFGILFFGLGTLRDAFDSVAEVFPVEQIAAAGLWGVALGILIGAALTMLIQSSSAALAIILTAAVTGVFTPLVGASLVIGANLGTTSTSVLASIGATANAKRLAWVHVSEKIFTGTIALALLWPMWKLADLISDMAGGTIATGLALYHTLFNVLGVLLMWFFAEHLFRFVERMVKQPDLSSETARYLDKTVLSSPVMGVGAMHSEQKRVFKQLLRRGRHILALADDERDGHDEVNTSTLMTKIADFSDELGKVAGMGNQSELYLNLNWALREMRELRLNLNALRKPDANGLHDALGEALVQLLSQLMGSGQLKALSAIERSQLMKAIKAERRTRRKFLLAQLEQGSADATLTTRQLTLIANAEDAAKRVLRVAGVLYPAQEAIATDELAASDIGRPDSDAAADAHPDSAVDAR
ncbi:Na/Pi cotransporter family protein [Aliidiomarina maris]|uniref:Na/Pi cotransporter family protein n=1 Tax=Aliidiomarina maris TaxID=531312 RepID=A0A327X5L7_9GAMM|nr:Na/Pi symporter [Aliidiomarina maris]RAK00825.1 phosphate:Na+ symporter [Aliidiomarina maris]RUO27186.1 Na/Pi cotransporter family protein [Aliidiomarina maris]